MRTAEFKRRLQGERERLARELSTLADGEIASAGHEHGYATHAADDATATFDQARAIALASHTHALLNQVERALHKIDEGSYGKCDQCGDHIGSERLAALPQATLCLACQSKVQGRH